MHKKLNGIAWVLLVVLSGGFIVMAETQAVDLPSFLRRQLAVTPSELASLERGQILVRLPKTDQTREVAAFAVMRLDVSGEFFVQQVRDIENFKTGEDVLQIGKFSDPPTIADLERLTLDAADVEAMRSCRLNSCDIKAPELFINRFRQVDWSAPDFHERATAVAKAVMLEHVSAYLRRGNTALGEYRDKAYRLNIADELRSLLQPAPYMYEYVPEFQKYLSDYPNAGPGDVEDFLYWSKEKVGFKPVISVTHVVIYRKPARNGINLLIASKGIYASHYMEASLGLTEFIHSDGSGPRRTYLIYTNRSRADALRGFFGGLKRSLITGTLRDATRRNMEMIKRKLEFEYWQ